MLLKGGEIINSVGMTATDIEKNPKGIDENDLELIATASLVDFIVVSEESQLKSPKNPANTKIPLACEINKIECCAFLEFLKNSKAVFA